LPSAAPLPARQIGVRINESGYIKQDGKHRTSVPGIYSAGDVEGGYKQIVNAAGQGVEAAMTIFEGLINPYWLDGKNYDDIFTYHLSYIIYLIDINKKSGTFFKVSHF
jgi:pyruvate/2-oxoglutarate dehydrogenase complex dihydrolipoamide dehydrogenase (E3) component